MILEVLPSVLLPAQEAAISKCTSSVLSSLYANTTDCKQLAMPKQLAVLPFIAQAFLIMQR